MAADRRGRWYLGIATVLSVLLVGTWRFPVGVFDAAGVPLAAKTALAALALGLSTRGYALTNGGSLPVALVGVVFAAGATVLLVLWAPSGLIDGALAETAVAAVALVPLWFALVAVQGEVDLLGRFLGPRR